MVHMQERGEIATCGMGNKVKVWDVRKPTSVRLKLVLNHGASEHVVLNHGVQYKHKVLNQRAFEYKPPHGIDFARSISLPVYRGPLSELRSRVGRVGQARQEPDMQDTYQHLALPPRERSR
eukprot:1159235-Pelagomonas_calceolata.AAC.7